jgi:hypothetical protein
MKNNSEYSFFTNRMNKIVFILILVIFQASPDIKAQENNAVIKTDTLKYKWERFSLSFGGLLTGLSSDFIVGSQQVGLGLSVNLEDAFGLESSTLVLRSELAYHLGKRQRHSIRFGYFGFSREAIKVLDSEIEIGNTTFPIGTEVNTKFNFQIYKGTYDYSFYMDERVKLGVTFGIYIMPISFSTSALGLSGEVAEFIAPLPVLGISTKFAITPKLFLKQGIEILYLEISNFKGYITDLNIRVEYNPWKHFGFGLGIDTYRLNISVSQKENVGLDFVGSIKTSYTGLLFYGKYYF